MGAKTPCAYFHNTIHSYLWKIFTRCLMILSPYLCTVTFVIFSYIVCLVSNCYNLDLDCSSNAPCDIRLVSRLAYWEVVEILRGGTYWEIFTHMCVCTWRGLCGSNCSFFFATSQIWGKWFCSATCSSNVLLFQAQCNGTSQLWAKTVKQNKTFLFVNGKQTKIPFQLWCSGEFNFLSSNVWQIFEGSLHSTHCGKLCKKRQR
jgi:hypothetical protein